MISVVIPAYNEASNIQATIAETLVGLKSSPYAEQYEIIVVDDHSSDNTFEKVEALQVKEVKAIRLSRNSGSFTAIRTGMREAEGDAVICLAADGQDDPAVIPALLEKWHQGAQIVWACRKSRANESWLIKLPALMFYHLLQWMTPRNKTGIDLPRADFYLMDRQVVDAINQCQERYTSLFGLILWSGFRQESVDYERKLRRSGSSKWNFTSRLNLAKDWIIAFSGLPLKAMIWLGFCISFLGFCYALFVFITHFTKGEHVEGWASVMMVVLILGGLNMAMLGVIGEYLWRNLEETRKRPLSFIERRTK